MNYTKAECLKWLAIPSKNPKTGATIQINKGVFKNLVDKCQKVLKPEDVSATNKEMLQWIFPNALDANAPITPPKQVKNPVLGKAPSYNYNPKNYHPPQKIPVLPKKKEKFVFKPKTYTDEETNAFFGYGPNSQKKDTEAMDGFGKPKKINFGEQSAQLGEVHKPDENLPKLDENVIIDYKKTEKMTIADSNLGKHTFKAPSRVKYQINKLTDENKNELAKKTAMNLITEVEFSNLVKKDQLMIDLLKAEKQLISYKLIQYNKVINQIEKDLDDPIIKETKEKEKANPLLSEDSKDQVIKELEKKLKSCKENREIITKRISILETLTPQLVKEKREKIMKIVDDPVNGINSLIGDSREEIRRSLLGKIISFAKAPQLYINRFSNYAIMGGAGTGKTMLAGVLGNFFYNLGVLNTSTVIYVTRADLVAKYVGQTAPLTRKYLNSSLEGVLFIDEAYQLSGCPGADGNFSSKDTGAEAITEIVNYIDKNIGLNIIIGAGYEDKMTDCFLKINEGMKRRFPNQIRLIDYTSSDLSNILYDKIKKMFSQSILTQSQKDYINLIIDKLNKKEHGNKKLFSNQAGDMLNLSNYLVQDLILNQQKGYTAENINNTFTRFFINKGLQIIIK